MVGMTQLCSRLIGDLVHALGVARANPSCIDPNPTCFNARNLESKLVEKGFNVDKSRKASHLVDDDLMMKALTVVFGMESNGKLNKEKANQVVKKLGLVSQEGKCDLDLSGGAEDEEVMVDDILDGMEDDGSDQGQKLLLEAFNIFDEDGNGFIEAVELKRVLQCLGLDKGWDLREIEKMLQVVDLNMDGKVDFSEFKLMMGQGRLSKLSCTNCIF